MKYFKLILSISLLFSMVSCNDENQTESKTASVLETPQVNENVLFYQTEKISDLAKMNSLILDNVTASNKKETITNLFNNCEVAINESNSINEISNLYDKCLNDVYDLLPADEEVSVALEIVDDAEELKVLKLLDEYAFRNHLIGAPLADSDWGYAGINLNTLDSNTWEYFFGENGTICQTTKENYWDVKPYMSNDNFIKGINLALEKALFTGMTPLGDIENPNVIIDISSCDYYKFDVELAKSYFKVALEEMIEQGIYDVSNLSEPINLTIEMAWNPWSSYNNYETYHKNIKTCLENVFNDESVTNGNFTLTINDWQSEYFGQLYAEKIYMGQFDMCFGIISSSSTLDYYNEYLRLSSTREFSNGYNVNWSIDTSSLDDCIVYNGIKYSYDEVLNAITK